jgi:hypothetical protein
VGAEAQLIIIAAATLLLFSAGRQLHPVPAQRRAHQAQPTDYAHGENRLQCCWQQGE